MHRLVPLVARLPTPLAPCFDQRRVIPCAWFLGLALSVVLLISWHILIQIIWHTRSFLAVPADPGKRLKLHIASEYASPKPFTPDSQLVRQIISSEVCQIMREATANLARIPGSFRRRGNRCRDNHNIHLYGSRNTGEFTVAKGKFVAYYRASTAKQGASGLGLEAQQESVRSYLNGGRWQMVSEVTEIESGKRNDRPALANALALCRVHGATLVIAKLDRLARNVNFISNLMESGVDFLAVDFPQADRLTIHILAAVAEHEAVMISARTKAALAAAKARGTRLGNPTLLIGSRASEGGTG
jgi:hypothetical protein